MYTVKLESGHEMRALFNVYAGGEEVAFLMPESRGELSVIEFKVN